MRRRCPYQPAPAPRKVARMQYRAISDVGFWVLAAVAVAAASSVSAFATVPLGVVGLVSRSTLAALWPMARSVGAERAWMTTAAWAIANAFKAVLAAHVVGIVLMALWL